MYSCHEEHFLGTTRISLVQVRKSFIDSKNFRVNNVLLECPDGNLQLFLFIGNGSRRKRCRIASIWTWTRNVQRERVPSMTRPTFWVNVLASGRVLSFCPFITPLQIGITRITRVCRRVGQSQHTALWGSQAAARETGGGEGEHHHVSGSFSLQRTSSVSKPDAP